MSQDKSVRTQKDLLTNEEILFVKLVANPVDGVANKALIADLAEYFGVRKMDVRLVSGETSRMKVVEIDTII